MTKEVTVIDDFRANLTRMEPEFKAALPAHIPVEKFQRVALTAFQQNPQLQEADKRSLWGAFVRCATDGLYPDGREAAIVCFKDKATYMPMVAGILKKVRNSGELSSITSMVVYAKDIFEYFIADDGEHLKHVPFLDGERGAPRLTYAFALTKDGGKYVEIITEDQMAAIRKMSRARDGNIWDGSFADEMRRKSAIRRLAKRLPMSTDLESVLHADDDLYELPTKPTVVESSSDVTPIDKGRRGKRMQAVVEAATDADIDQPPTEATPFDTDEVI